MYEMQKFKKSELNLYSTTFSSFVIPSYLRDSSHGYVVIFKLAVNNFINENVAPFTGVLCTWISIWLRI